MVCKQSLFMSHDVHGLQRASLNHYTLHFAIDRMLAMRLVITKNELVKTPEFTNRATITGHHVSTSVMQLNKARLC